jgi:hypothetical protein
VARQRFEDLARKLQVNLVPKLIEAGKVHPKERVVALRDDPDAPALVTNKAQFSSIDGGVEFVPSN